MANRFIRPVTLIVVFALLFASLPANAGTTGNVSGTVLDAVTKAPLAGVHISAASPSQTATATTDAAGRFTLLSLSPDSYTLSLEKQGFDASSLAGITVTADATQTLTFSLQRALREIGRVSARSNAGLVKPGTTADVYSVTAAQQDRVSAVGGGGSLNSAYSAIATVPGAFVPPNQSGYNQTVHVRGGDAGEVGYEFDGIPVNRGFDNYPSGAASTLGQLELQVYTGASPANAEAQGLSGFVNQVIRSGTFPGFENVQLDAGGPTFYHSINVEAGGANPSRTFSYYVGLGGYNQDHRYVDQFNGASISNEFGAILNTCDAVANASCFANGKPVVGAAGAAGYQLGPYNFGGSGVPNVAVRSTVVNLHFGIPHGRNGLRDDVQVLYDNDSISTALFSSALDEGLANLGGSPETFTDSWQYGGALGSFLPANPSALGSLVMPYFYPASTQNRTFGGPIPLDARDVGYNQQAIAKLQYQRNFSQQAYLRIYGYTYYSTYTGNGANSSFQPYVGLDSGDYELNSHTRGLSATFADQFDARNLVEAQGSYTESTATRVYNTQMFGGADNFAVLVNRNDLTSGTCYALNTAGTAASPTTCDPAQLANSTNVPTYATLSGIGCATRGLPSGCTTALPADVSALTCGTGPCGYYVGENGAYGEYNFIKPIFTGYSITDQFKPTDKLLFNIGVRLDHYKYVGDDTTGSSARAFWFNAFNRDTCFNTAGATLADKTTLGIPISANCSSAAGYQNTALTNVPSQIVDFNVLQPRLGATYTITPDTVIRASYGKYNQQPSSAYQQYNALQQDLPALLGPEFYSYGFTTPGHSVRPSVSYNYDLSLEHHFKGTNLSFKLTPYFRQTQDEIENFYLNVKAGLISGLNIGSQTAKGVEFAFDAGNFDRNGFAGQLSFTYTNSYVNYATLSNGTSIVTPINGDIANYNAYTSACAPGGKASGGRLCGATSNGAAAAPCYTSLGAADATCAAGDIANPYWNAPVQPLLDPGARYTPYTVFPSTIGTGANGFIYPYVATLLLNYQHNRLAITPSLQFQAGNRYGAPETMPGIDPAACTAALAGSTTRDPRYPYGSAGGAPYDATTCGTLNAIPDSYTGQFDGIGAFRQPAQLLGNLRISYKASKNVEVVATFANIIDRCFGGQKTAFTYYSSPSVCSYTSLASGLATPVGNVYNPGDNVQTFLKYPYEPSFGTYNDNSDSTIQPFAAYVSLRFHL